MVRRAVLTVLALGVYSLVLGLLIPQLTLTGAAQAGRQFADSDRDFLWSSFVLRVMSGAGLAMTAVLVLALAAIWYRPAQRRLPRIGPLGLMALALALPAHRALAYADTTDKTEAYTILPNESAFWIPDAGANKETQGQFDSEAYLQERKIAVKRFVIPHQKLGGSGGYFGWDFYVPTGRLIIVDRTPYSREWVAPSHRGTSPRDESFPCQSSEGLNISVGVSVGASVAETNAAKYLYRFGVAIPSGNRSDPAVIFTSVYYSRRLSEVMDDVGRKKVQTLVCDEITSRSFDKVNAEAVKIMESVRKSAGEYFASVGITLEFIGWADSFTFDRDVQDAVNRRYIASKDREIAETLLPYTATLQALAAAQALRNFGDKSDGRLPTTIVGLPANVEALLTGLLRAGSPPPAPPPGN